MPASSNAVRICPNCDGFPIVSISVDIRRLKNGTLPTLAVECRECSGTGTVPAPIAHPTTSVYSGR